MATVPSVARADATVDGFYRSDYVSSGVFDETTNNPPRSDLSYVPPTVEEAPLILPYLNEPKLYQGKFSKTTRGVEATEVIDGDESYKGTVIVPVGHE